MYLESLFPNERQWSIIDFLLPSGQCARAASRSKIPSTNPDISYLGQRYIYNSIAAFRRIKHPANGIVPQNMRDMLLVAIAVPACSAIFIENSMAYSLKFGMIPSEKGY